MASRGSSLTPDQLARAIELHNKCWTQTKIAAELGRHQTTVGRSLARHYKKVFAQLVDEAVAIKAAQIAQLEWLASSATRAFERSLRAEKTVKVTETEGEGDEGESDMKTETTRKGQSGNPALIREVRGCLADIRKILGLDAPPPKPVDREDEEDYVVDISPPTPEADPSQSSDDPPA